MRSYLPRVALGANEIEPYSGSGFKVLIFIDLLGKLNEQPWKGWMWIAPIVWNKIGDNENKKAPTH